MQAIANFIADVTGVTQNRITTQALSEIHNLATKYFQATTVLRAADTELGSYAVTLIPHRSRCEAASKQIHEILTYQQDRCGNEGQESVSLLENALKNVDLAIATINDHLRPLEEAVQEARALVDTTLTDLLQHLEANTDHVNEDIAIAAEARVVPEIYLPGDLDAIEQQIADFSHQLVEQTKSETSQLIVDWGSDVPSFLKYDGPRCEEWTPSVVEIRREVEEANNLCNAFAELKERLRQFSHHNQTPEEEREFAVLRSQAIDLEHWLALRGIPVRNGSFVLPPTDDDEDMEYAFYSDPGRPIEEAQSSIEETATLMQLGLFGNTDLERPVANNGGEEVAWTERDYQAHVAKCEARVMSWLDKMPDQANPDLPSKVKPHTEGLEELPEVGLNDSISYIAPAKPLARRRQFELEIRRGAWAVELEHEALMTAQRIREESPWIIPLPGITGSSESVSAPVSAHCT